ncbi:MAG: ROK family protein [Anaerolineales bacterium]
MKIGIDVGGTKIAGGLLDGETLVHEHKVPTSRAGADAVLRQIGDLVRTICDNAHIKVSELSGVGVGFPATLDYAAGKTLLIPNILGDWWEKPVVNILSENLGLSVSIINDARAFTLAEARLGAGQGAPSVACFTLGTGIGGGIAINGKLHLGLSGSAGEVGHHSINFNGLPDGSGAPGGFEGYASGPAITTMAVKAVLQGIDTTISDLVNGDINRITPQIIMQAAEQEDAVAIEILNRAGFYLGVGIANVLSILAPHRVVIGGGLVALGDWIMRPIRQTIPLYCRTLPIEAIQIHHAALGNKAGIIGAALWAGEQT